MGTLVLGSLLGVGTSPVQAQTYIAPAPRYAAPTYAAPAPRYAAPTYAAPAPRYAAPTYAAPADTSVAQGDYDFYTQALHGG
jgi:hypothetical protein